MMQQEETPKIRRIRQVSVTNLFGIFNHTLPFNMDERITIIHGPNGFGKTMMLKLLHALFSQSNRLLQTIPFDEFCVDFEDGMIFGVSKTNQLLSTTEDEHAEEQRIIFHATGEKAYILRPRSFSEVSSLAHAVSEMLGQTMLGFSAHSEDLQNIRLGEASSINIHFGNETKKVSLRSIDDRAEMPIWLREMRNTVPLRLIETQRLLSSTQSSKRNKAQQSEYAVTEDSNSLIDIIKSKLAESTSLSNSLDRTFPARSINATIEQSPVTENDLIDKLKELEKKRSRLMATGLLDTEKETASLPDYGQGIALNTQAVLAVYADDTERKLKIFDELAEKIDLLTTIINNRFLYKTMTIDKEQGFVLTSQNGTILPLEDLSSGEQHELVLFYELLFRVTPGSLILIDEPELSLHLVWQENFLKDVQQVARLSNIDIVLATHSPDIISGRRDLVIELEAPKHGGL